MPLPLIPKYAENIIVGVVFGSDWLWYVSPPLIWVLDLNRYSALWYARAGVRLDMSDVRPVLIANKDTAPSFLSYMKQYQVNTDFLRNIVKETVPIEDLDDASKEARLWLLDETLELFPSLLVNFDRQILRTAYAEPMRLSFEAYVPLGWKAYDESILPYVPEEHRYWIIDGVDYIERLCSVLEKHDKADAGSQS